MSEFFRGENSSKDKGKFRGECRFPVVVRIVNFNAGLSARCHASYESVCYFRLVSEVGVFKRAVIMSKAVQLTGNERFFSDDEIIVSKTDLKGRITYANKIFLDIADYTEKEVLGQPHSLIRHPAMPRCIFKMLWQSVEAGKEIFAYVINRTKFGDHYWVYAHVTPSFDSTGRIVGYHSNRRVPDTAIIKDLIVPLYRDLREAENKAADRKKGLEVSEQMVVSMLAEQGLAYDEYISTLGQGRRRGFR